MDLTVSKKADHRVERLRDRVASDAAKCGLSEDTLGVGGLHLFYHSSSDFISVHLWPYLRQADGATGHPFQRQQHQHHEKREVGVPDRGAGVVGGDAGAVGDGGEEPLQVI